MLCPSCGAGLSDTARFCAECGTSIKPSDSAAAASLATAAPAGGAVNPLRAARGATEPYPTSPSMSQPFTQPAAADSAAGMAAAAPALWGAPPAPQVASGWGQQNVMTTNVNVGGPNILIAQRNNGPSLFVRIIWFFFIGSWLGPLTFVLAYLLIIPVVTIPLSMGLFNRIPQVMTLRPRNTTYGVTQSRNLTTISETTLDQVAWYWRALYFVFVGSWAVVLWFALAEVIGIVTLGLGLPLSFWMFNRVGAVATLYRT